MKFELKPTKEKEAAIYKTIYIKRRLAEQIEAIAGENKTSFNNVVVSMIESCLKEDELQHREGAIPHRRETSC